MMTSKVSSHGLNQSSVAKLYQSIIDDVINNVREAFLDDGVDEHVLQELKNTWESKLVQSRAIESPVQPLPISGIPLFINAQPAVVYQTIGNVRRGVQMFAPGPHAGLALPNTLPVIYQQKIATVPSTQTQLYTAYQAANQPIGQPLMVTTHKQLEQTKTAESHNQPSAIIQVDGSSENEKAKPCCSKGSLGTSQCGTHTSVDTNGSSNFSPLTMKITLEKSKRPKAIIQVDGSGRDSSSSSDDDFDDGDDDDDDEDGEDADEQESQAIEDADPLCSDDDISDEDPVELFDTDNVVVCQYDKIHHAKCRWKFNLKLGIMNLNGTDQVFQKATGDAKW